MPDLIIIAGCNGAGKSTFSTSFLPEGQTSFDYDKLFIENYNKLPDSELREKFARDQTTREFENAVEEALKNKSDFCYETNFDAYPIYWVEKFRNEGFSTNMIFFCLENQGIARHRVQVRTEFKGHYVDDTTIDLKWKAGYKNLNLHFAFFDNLLIVDNSINNQVYSNLLQIENGHAVLMTDELPDYFPRRIPEIYNLITQ